MTTVKANGVTLGVEHFGDAAAPLVLLAGGTTMLSWPDALCVALARGGRHVVRYDLRDCGTSTTVNPKAPAYKLRDLAADAAALARELDDRPAHLAGIGVGGMVAQVAALDHPDAFSALTLAGTRPVAPGRLDDDLPDHDAATMARLFSRSMPDCSDRAAVAEFAAGRAEILGDDPAAARARPPSASGTARPARSPRCRWPTSWTWCSPSSTASRAGASACPRLRCRRSWCTVAATRSSQSATAKHLRARSPVRGYSCSNGPRARSPMRSPVRSRQRCLRSSAHGPGANGRRPPQESGAALVRKGQSVGHGEQAIGTVRMGVGHLGARPSRSRAGGRLRTRRSRIAGLRAADQRTDHRDRSLEEDDRDGRAEES